MGYLKSLELQLKGKEEDYRLMQQFLECYGFDVLKDCYPACSLDFDVIEFDEEPDDELNDMYAILSKVFDDFTLYYSRNESHSVSDWYYEISRLYKSKEGYVEIEESNYCYGDGEGLDENHNPIVKNKKRKIKILEPDVEKVNEMVKKAENLNYDELKNILIEKVINNLK